MADNTLDQINATHGGDARRWVASLIAAGGTNKQVVAALLKTYNVTVTPRSVSQWRNHDPVLVEFIAEMEAAKSELDPAALLRPAVNRARAVADLFAVCEEFPAFAALMHRERDRLPARAAPDGWGLADEDATVADDENPNAALAVLLAGHETDEAFRADCLSRLAADERESVAHRLPAA